MAQRIVLFLDGGFIKKKLEVRLGRFPKPSDIVAFCREELLCKERLTGGDLLRIYFYDAPPFEGQAKNPLDGSKVEFSNTPAARLNRALLDSLELEPDFAVRRGTLIHTGWKLGSSALESLAKNQRPVKAQDLVPEITQKGVDLRIGLDMAWIALKRIADIVVLVTGDSDFVPAMKLARTEGIRVYLETLGHRVRRELKVHADLVL